MVLQTYPDGSSESAERWFLLLAAAAALGLSFTEQSSRCEEVGGHRITQLEGTSVASVPCTTAVPRGCPASAWPPAEQRDSVVQSGLIYSQTVQLPSAPLDKLTDSVKLENMFLLLPGDTGDSVPTGSHGYPGIAEPWRQSVCPLAGKWMHRM